MTLLLSVISYGHAAGLTNPHFVGVKTCALCHQAIAAKQERTAMANTWQGSVSSWLPSSFTALVADDLRCELDRGEEKLTYSVTFPGQTKFSLPVEISMGGTRHGLGFLLPIREVGGMALDRPALMQARYAWSPEKNKLLLAPGCSAAKPQSLESALGLTLSPTFESRCLSCHGQPGLHEGGKEGGVRCESCHGPGSEHIASLGRGDSGSGMVNLKRSSTEDSIAVCASCHVGLTRFSDPSPDDLLIANQVTAIRSSECFLQSGKAFSCTACHDPHQDTAAGDQRAVNACLGCHARRAKPPHAAICPVNAAAGCVDCHMPSVEMGPLHLVDHLIRVHPEQKVRVTNRGAELRTQVRPVSEYLRLFAASSNQAAQDAHNRISLGESFYGVALASSLDNTAAIGGFLGRKQLTELGGALSGAAAELRYGEISKVVQSGGRWVFLQRLPRDFRWNAEELEQEAEERAIQGDPVGAIGKAQEALMIYPQFLRALNFIGVTFAKSGNPKKGAEVLRVADRLYPQDAATVFALGSALELLGDRGGAMVAYRRAVDLEGDFVAAYAKLGMISYTEGDWHSAASIFRQGLQIDPMCAELYLDLSLALARSGDAQGAKRAMDLANKLEPGISSADPNSSALASRSGSF